MSDWEQGLLALLCLAVFWVAVYEIGRLL